jgi:ubiquinone/menaquinone biosynthesis C-methylase UbiE
MLDYAKEKVGIKHKIKFIKSNFNEYFETVEDESLDCVIMQYAIGYIDSYLKGFLKPLSKKLKKGGIFIANLGVKSLENTPNVSFLVNNQKINKKYHLQYGDVYTINFLENGKTISSTDKNYFTDKEIITKSEEVGLTAEIFNKNEIRMLILKK